MGRHGDGHTYGATDNKVWWYTNGMPSQMGDWCAGTYDFRANASIPDCSGSPWDLAWSIWGDTYGDPPHSVSGTVQKSCLMPGVYVTPFSQSGNACVGENADYTLNLFNYSGQDGTFAVTVTDTWGMTFPATVSAAAGATVPFACTVWVPCAGGSDTATVTAAGNGYSGSAAVTSSNLDGWAAEPPSPLPVMGNAAISYGGKLYVVGGWGAYGAVQIWDGSTWTPGAASGLNGAEGDACPGLDASGHPVIDLLGDTYHYLNIRRYDMDADSWSSFPYPAGYPATGLAMPDIVSMLQHTGQNVCYISGSAQLGAAATPARCMPTTPTRRPWST